MDERAERRQLARMEKKVEARAKADGVSKGRALADLTTEQFIGLKGGSERREFIRGLQESGFPPEAMQFIRNMASILDDFDGRMSEAERLEHIENLGLSDVATAALRRRAEMLKGLTS